MTKLHTLHSSKGRGQSSAGQVASKQYGLQFVYKQNAADCMRNTYTMALWPVITQPILGHWEGGGAAVVIGLEGIPTVRSII